MTIPIKEEPKDLHELPSEVCYFCQKNTRYWHLKTNNPVCPMCSKIHRVIQLPNWFKYGKNNDKNK